MKFLWLCVAVIFTLSASAKEFLVFFGTYTNALSRGIYVAKLDSETGKISEPQLAAEAANPNYLAISPDEHFLYSANGTKFNGGKDGSVSAFAIDKKSGQLKWLDEKSSGGNGPCHVSVDATGKFLFAANYGSGSLKSFLLNADGSIGADGSVIQNHGSSVNKSRQNSAHAHFMCADPSNKFALACDLGLDQIAIYKINSDATLTENSVAKVPPGSGARHLVFGRDGKSAYCLNEMGCTISIFNWDPQNGKLDLRETISALPPEVAVSNSFTAAEIVISPNGKFLYATIRGHDSVSVFEIGKRGALKFLQNISSGGKVPRGLGIDPTGKWLFTAHQKSNDVVEFSIDRQTGKISPADRDLKIGSPVDVKFVAAD